MSLNKPSEELVLDLINEANDRTLTLNQVNIRDPEAFSFNGRNTRAMAEGIGNGYFGNYRIYYDRLHLDTALPNNGPEGFELMVPNDGFVDTVEVCERLNQMFDYQISEDDIIRTAIDTSQLPATATIYAKGSSLAWVGQKTMTFVADRPFWKDTFSEFTLDSFVMPTGDVTGLTDPVATGNAIPTFKDGSNMLFGTDVVAGGMLISTNTELEVGIGARAGTGQAVVTPDVDNVYNLSLLGSTTWKLVHSLGYLNNGVLDDGYSICIVITRPDNSTYTLGLEKAGEDYFWVGENPTVTVPVGYISEDGGVVQGFIDAEEIRTVLQPTANSSAGAPLGVYSVRLQARRKNSVAPRLIATILVKAYNN